MRKPVHDDHWMRWGAMVLRRRREALGLSREDVAQQTGLSTATLRNLERGKVRTPALTTLRVLCDALSLPMPGEDGLYLSIEHVSADRLRKVARDALDEYALRSRGPKRFVAAAHPSQPPQRVIRDRDLALRLCDLLRGVTLSVSSHGLCDAGDFTSLIHLPASRRTQRIAATANAAENDGEVGLVDLLRLERDVAPPRPSPGRLPRRRKSTLRSRLLDPRLRSPARRHE